MKTTVESLAEAKKNLIENITAMPNLIETFMDGDMDITEAKKNLIKKIQANTYWVPAFTPEKNAIPVGSKTDEEIQILVELEYL